MHDSKIKLYKNLFRNIQSQFCTRRDSMVFALRTFWRSPTRANDTHLERNFWNSKISVWCHMNRNWLKRVCWVYKRYVPLDQTTIDCFSILIFRFLTRKQKRWLNEYNARIRTLVGEELKAQLNMQAFYWMMNKTRHIIEYYPESEYRKHNNSDFVKMTNAFGVILILNVLIYFTNWM